MTNINQTLYTSIISSFFEVVITHPLDLYKTNKQINSNFTLKHFTNLKYKDVYAGFKPRVLGVIPIRTTFLFSQDYFGTLLTNQTTLIKNTGIIIGGSFAQTLFDTPIENIKINHMLKNKIYYNFKNMYNGFIPHISRNTIFFANVYLAKLYGTNNFDKALYGGLGGFIGSYLSHPFDTIKTWQQSNNLHHLNNFNNLSVVGKITLLWKGANIRATMGMINMTVSLFIFENLKMLI